MEVCLYLRRAGLHLRKLVFQIDGALLSMASDLYGKLSYFRHVGHHMSLTTGADKPQRMDDFRNRKSVASNG